MWGTTNWSNFIPNHPDMMEEVGFDKAQISPQNGYNNVPAFQLAGTWEPGARVPWRTIDNFFSELASTEGGLEGRLWNTACQHAATKVVSIIRATQLKEEAMPPLSRTIWDRERYTEGLTFIKRCLVHSEWARYPVFLVGPDRAGFTTRQTAGSRTNSGTCRRRPTGHITAIWLV